MMNTDTPADPVPPEQTPPPPGQEPGAKSQEPPSPPPFAFADLARMAQFGVLPEEVGRLLLTAFHLHGEVLGKTKQLKDSAGHLQLMTDALVCMTKLNGGRTAVSLNIKKTISPRAAFNATYDHKKHEAVFELHEPRAGIVLATEMPKGKK